MSEQRWPLRSRSVCEFLVSIGIDPSTVLEDGVNEYGYREPIVGADGFKVRNGLGNVEAILRPWPNGREDYLKFEIAHLEDENRVWELAERCPGCGEPILDSLIDVEV